jgi:hypothetical protein
MRPFFASANAVIETFFAGIDFSIDKHPVNPAFQSGWCSNPPKREIYIKQVAALMLLIYAVTSGASADFSAL